MTFIDSKEIEEQRMQARQNDQPEPSTSSPSHTPASVSQAPGSVPQVPGSVPQVSVQATVQISTSQENNMFSEADINKLQVLCFALFYQFARILSIIVTLYIFTKSGIKNRDLGKLLILIRRVSNLIISNMLTNYEYL